MSYKTILVHGGSDTARDVRLSAARAIGRTFQSHVVGLAANTWAGFPAPLVTADPGTVAILMDAIDTSLETAAKAFRKVFEGYAPSAEWRSEKTFPEQAVIGSAACADLVVLGRRPRHGNPDGLPDVGAIVMAAGAPVLVAPPTGGPFEGHVAVVAWKNTREARRAVGDALPLLQAASQVLVVSVDNDPETGSQLGDVVARLSRHGVVAEAVVEKPREATVAEDLVAIANRAGADLLVVGAYGHSRLQEWSFGGVTADLLDSCPTYVLFAR